MNNSNQSKLTLIPVMIAFFTMGFVDLVGAVSNNMQEDCRVEQHAGRFRTLRLGCQLLPVARVLLVPYLLGAYGHAHE